MTWAQLCKLGLAMPSVTVETWYRTPALKVRGKGFVRIKEDGETVVFAVDSVEEQDFLIATRPALYFITDHYVGYPWVQARLAELTTAEAKERLERAWQLKAPSAVRRMRAPAAAVTRTPARATATARTPARSTASTRTPASTPATARTPARATATTRTPARTAATARTPASTPAATRTFARATRSKRPRART